MLRKLNLLPVNQIARRLTTTAKVCSDDLFVHRDSADNNAQTPFEFTEANMKRIEALLKNYPASYPRSVVSFALDIVQRQIGWVPIAAMNKVADMLSMPRMRVYEWATFYTMNKRQYRGKFHIKVCVTTPCMIMGSDVILRAAELAACTKLGELSKDGLFGIDEVQCQGACVNAPVVVINDDYYGDSSKCEIPIQSLVHTFGTFRDFLKESRRYYSNSSFYNKPKVRCKKMKKKSDPPKLSPPKKLTSCCPPKGNMKKISTLNMTRNLHNGGKNQKGGPTDPDDRNPRSVFPIPPKSMKRQMPSPLPPSVSPAASYDPPCPPTPGPSADKPLFPSPPLPNPLPCPPVAKEPGLGSAGPPHHPITPMGGHHHQNK